jgi:ribosomal-protein-alanine N-acetyltransferase
MNADQDWELRGEKTTLRPFGAQDITAAYLGWLNDPRVVRLSNQRFRTHDAASSLAYLRGLQDSGNLFAVIQLTSTGRPVGTLTAYISAAHLTADVGIMVGNPQVWGQGVGFDAWKTWCEWLLAARGLRKLTAGTLDCNHAMIRIMERSGMHREAVRRQQELVEGEPHDILYYARFRGD